MTDALLEAKGKVHRYWNVDGLHEIAIACIFLLTAGWVWASDISPAGSVWRAVLSVSFPIMLCGGIMGEKRVVAAIRQRLTFRRTGFVEFRKPSPRQRAVSAVFGVAVAIALTVIVAQRGTAALEEILAPGMAALVGLFMGWLGFFHGPRRFVAVAAASVAAGLAIAYARLDMSAGMAAYYAAMGAVLLGSGVFTLWQYLRTSREPAEL
jgi:hypothetical protein